jgi:hypothetical protein
VERVGSVGAVGFVGAVGSVGRESSQYSNGKAPSVVPSVVPSVPTVSCKIAYKSIRH